MGGPLHLNIRRGERQYSGDDGNMMLVMMIAVMVMVVMMQVVMMVM